MKRVLYYLGLGLIGLGVWLAFIQPDRALKLAGFLCIPCGAALAWAMLRSTPHVEAKPQPQKATVPWGRLLLILVAIFAVWFFFHTAGEISCTGFQCTIRKEATK